MNICVINGSPRGRYSTTLQTILYLQKRYPAHEFTIINAGGEINRLEKDLSPFMEAVKDARLVLFSYPVYTFIAPSQLHRFIAKIKSSGCDLSGKYASQITTSKHFYDVTAHRYIEDNCHDLGMRFIGGLSADMDDLLTEKGQKEAEAFFEYAIWCVENGVCEPAPLKSGSSESPYTRSFSPVPKKDGFDTVIVADLREGDESLKNLIADFDAVYPYKTRLVNISEYPFKGGCLGCFNCAGDGKCVYNDGFDAFLRGSIQSADAIVLAFAVRDHSMGPTFKTYDDRQFCNGHRTVTEGTPFCYIVSGDYPCEDNLRMIIEARCEVGGNFLSGVAYDAPTLEASAKRLGYALERKYATPRNFFGVGGMKIFRDLIWLMRGLMKADHEFYKSRGVYDFPQKRRLEMLKMCFLGALLRNKRVKSRMGNKMNEAMSAPYRKIIESAKAK